MPRTSLAILDRTGDLKLTWDHADLADCERIRAEVEALSRAGYSFFLVTGEPADAVTAGAGTLIVRRLTAAEVIAPPPDEPTTTTTATEAPDPQSDDEPAKRRGRPPKAERRAVAVRPLRGG